LIVEIKKINKIETVVSPFYENCIEIDDTVRIFTDKEGWGYLRDCCMELLGQKEWCLVEKEIEKLQEANEQLKEQLKDYVSKYGGQIMTREDM